MSFLKQYSVLLKNAQAITSLEVDKQEFAESDTCNVIVRTR